MILETAIFQHSFSSVFGRKCKGNTALKCLGSNTFFQNYFLENSLLLKFVSRRVAIITTRGKKDNAVDGKIGSFFDELVFKDFRAWRVCAIVIA